MCKQLIMKQNTERNKMNIYVVKKIYSNKERGEEKTEQTHCPCDKESSL